MIAETEHVVLLHGLGDGPESWDDQIRMLPEGVTGHALPIRGLSADVDRPFGFREAADGVLAGLDSLGLGSAHICGLSLGAMVALQVAIDAPDRVLTLSVSGAQVRPSRAVMLGQQAIFRILPARMISADPLVKARLIRVMSAASRVDFRAALEGVTAPTSVLCGLSDRPNLAAARTLAAGIPGARLHLLEGGHLLHQDNPEGFARTLRERMVG